MTRRRRAMITRGGALVALLLSATPVDTEIALPAGFTAQVYVTGDGFDSGAARNARGIPATSTLAFDHTAALYLARTGRRYVGGEADDLTPVYRIPPGGARLNPEAEPRYLHGPPLRNPQVAALRAGRELLVTTFDRDRRLGVLYRLLDGRAALLAGGTPPTGAPPLLRQPEGAAVDSGGNLYVADREQGIVVRLDPTGRVLDPRWAVVRRPRVLAMDDRDQLWIGADGNAEAPWQQGPGEIWRVRPDGTASLILLGPMPAGIALSPGGHLFVADRHAGAVFALTPEGRRVDFATFSDGDAPRGLAFAPVTPDSRRIGIAGELFVIVINRGAWPVNEIVRITGPADEFVRQRLTSP